MSSDRGANARKNRATDPVWKNVEDEILGEVSFFLKGRLRFKSVGKKAAQKYLLDLCTLARKLSKHLDEMPSEVWEALPAPFPDAFNILPGDLNTFRRALINKLARPASEAIVTIREDPQPGRTGRRGEWKAQYVTRRTDEVYKEQTGKTATRQELQGSLERLFPALNIRANPEHYIRARRERMEKK